MRNRSRLSRTYVPSVLYASSHRRWPAPRVGGLDPEDIGLAGVDDDEEVGLVGDAELLRSGHGGAWWGEADGAELHWSGPGRGILDEEDVNPSSCVDQEDVGLVQGTELLCHGHGGAHRGKAAGADRHRPVPGAGVL